MHYTDIITSYIQINKKIGKSRILTNLKNIFKTRKKLWLSRIFEILRIRILYLWFDPSTGDAMQCGPSFYLTSYCTLIPSFL